MAKHYAICIPDNLSAATQTSLNVRLGALNESSKAIKEETGKDLVYTFTNEEDWLKFIQIHATLPDKSAGKTDAKNEDSKQYAAQKPWYTFATLIVSAEVQENLIAAISLFAVEKKVFDDWGLRQIEPKARTALNFYGPPGTGKTLAAHALAHKLAKNILVASYAEIESKYHGDGPKNVQAIFRAAEEADALLFIDEADSLLSKRLTNVTQGSEQAINSMRSQLLICLEQFSGTVIFSTNLVENYDKAFETRVRHIKFSLPDETCRQEIWRIHLPEQLPRDETVDLKRLARELDNICGRDIKNAVIDAATRVALKNKESLSFADLAAAIGRIKKSRIEEISSMKPAEGVRGKQMKKKLRAALGKNDRKNKDKS